LCQFPLIESDTNIDKNEIVSSEKFINLFPDETTISLFNKKEIIHKLSHQHLHTQFWVVETVSLSKAKTNWKDIKKYPVPVLIANFIEEFESKSN
jgi:A/G-specific adenine glycosylase